MNATANGYELCENCSKNLIPFAGQSVYLRKSENLKQQNNKLISLRNKGWSIIELANEYNLTIRSVYRILSKYK